MGDAAQLGERLGDAGNVLFLGPSVTPAVDTACMAHLPTGARAHVIAVNFSPNPGTWLDRYDEHAGESPAGVVLVTTSDTSIDETAYDWPVAVEGLSSPADLTGIGMVVSKYLERWQGRETVALCFDSLTALLQYEDAKDVYRFLHIISTRLAGTAARSHFHLDPMTQDDQTVSTLRSSFDAVATFDPDAETWEVARR
ncbi:hypothetical protein [Halosegnis sp.]|uniref:DUF7504 family protein n=1 Tax=Halosegnis sp. TaxID=2864959 RepID=UPI0035D4D7CA